MKNRLAKIPLLFCLFSLANPLHAAVQPWTHNNVTWSSHDGTPTYYNPSTEEGGAFDKLPTEGEDTSPVWSISNTHPSAQSYVQENYLAIDTLDGAPLSYKTTEGWSDFSRGVTIETRLRIDQFTSGSSAGGSLLIGLGDKFNAVEFRRGSIIAYGGAKEGLDLRQWTTIRMTITGIDATPTLSIYINNELTPSIVSTTFTSGTLDYLQFGTASSKQTSRVHWDYVSWTDTGAFAPIPEGGTAALFAIAGLGILAMQRLNSRRNRHEV